MDKINLPDKGHIMVIGATGTGKTTAAIQIALEAAERGRAVLCYFPDLKDQKIVFDKVGGVCSELHIFTDLASMLASAEQCENCLIIWDEVTTTFKVTIEGHSELSSYARHNNHQVLFIGHLYTSLKPLIRLNCEHLIMFRVGQGSCKMADEDFSDERIYQVKTQKKYEFMQITVAEDPIFHKRRELFNERQQADPAEGMTKGNKPIAPLKPELEPQTDESEETINKPSSSLTDS